MIFNHLRKYVGVFGTGLLVYVFVGVNPALASGSCTATVSPSSVKANSTTAFSFSITNTGTRTITYIRLDAPSSNFSLQNYGVPGWSVNGNNSFAELSGGSIAAGDTFQFNYYATAGSLEAPSANWGVSTNDGSGIVSCTGSLGTAITGVADITPPSISDPEVSNITSTTATISWTTDEPSTTNVDYGTTVNLGSTISDPSMVTSHSITLTGLIPNTTYFFDIYSIDASGNQARNPQNTLTTASATSTGTATISTTTTATPISSSNRSSSSQNTTPTPLVDKTPPQVFLTTDFSSSFKTPPKITGKAVDSGDINIGVFGVDYSTDGGSNWLPVDKIYNEGSQSTLFEFTPDIFDDGDYKIKVRARDLTGNYGYSSIYTLVIDRLPPQVGPIFIGISPLVFYPQNGFYLLGKNLDYQIKAYAIGGPIKIDLYLNDKKISLEKEKGSGFWSGKLLIEDEGEYLLKAKSIDGAKNETERDLGKIKVVESGKITDGKDLIKEAQVSVYVYSPLVSDFVLWDGEFFGQKNPQPVKDGRYFFLLPEGKYFLRVKAPGFRLWQSEIFEVKDKLFLNQEIVLEKQKAINLGFISIPFDFSVSYGKLNFSQPDKGNFHPLLGKDLPEVDLNGFEKGKRSLITFLNTFDPQTSAYLENINGIGNQSILAVFPQQSSSVVNVYQKIGNYQIKLLSDDDGLTVEPFFINSLPVSFFVDERGKIEKVEYGVLKKEEVEDYFSVE